MNSTGLVGLTGWGASGNRFEGLPKEFAAEPRRVNNRTAAIRRSVGRFTRVFIYFVNERIMEKAVAKSRRADPRARAVVTRMVDLPEHAAWRELVRIGGLIRRLSEPHFARYGVSPAQWGVLRSLSRLENRGVREPRMHELGQELLVHPPSLSATLERMARAGLVTRRNDPEDHRSRLIALTDVGRGLLDRVVDDHRVWIDRLMGGLATAERERLGRLLGKLSCHMAALADEPVTTGSGPIRSRPRRKGRTRYSA